MVITYTVALISRLFDFILASRKGNDVEPDFVYYLFRFMRSKRDHQVPRNVLIISIALRILLDVYPLKIYSKIILTLANINV